MVVLCSAPSVPQPVFTITEKALAGVFSVIVKTGFGTDGSFYSTAAVLSPVKLCSCNVNTEHLQHVNSNILIVTTTMIQFIALFSKQAKPRLQKWYQAHPEKVDSR